MDGTHEPSCNDQCTSDSHYLSGSHDDVAATRDRLRGVRETLTSETETEERRKLREVKEREAHERNPYPNRLRD